MNGIRGNKIVRLTKEMEKARKRRSRFHHTEASDKASTEAALETETGQMKRVGEEFRMETEDEKMERIDREIRRAERREIKAGRPPMGDDAKAQMRTEMITQPKISRRFPIRRDETSFEKQRRIGETLSQINVSTQGEIAAKRAAFEDEE